MLFPLPLSNQIAGWFRCRNVDLQYSYRVHHLTNQLNAKDAVSFKLHLLSSFPSLAPHLGRH
jgi:hypothetical protein